MTTVLQLQVTNSQACTRKQGQFKKNLI